MLMNETLIREALDVALSSGADFAEVFVEDTLNNTLQIVDEKVDTVSSVMISGVGIRAYLGLRSVSATSSDLGRNAVLAAAGTLALNRTA